MGLRHQINPPTSAMFHRRALLAAAVLSGLTVSIHAQVNGYAEVTAIAGTTLTIGAVDETSGTFEDGQQAILMQMEDDVVGGNVANNITFGNVSAISSAGFWETVTIASHVESAGVPTSIVVTAALAHTFHIGPKCAVQLITHPQLGTPDYTTVAAMNATPWNGAVGGVLTFQVTGILTLAHNIRADGAGFRGGTPSANYDGACVTTPYMSSVSNYGQKGESIQKKDNLNYQYARGKFANGGGGGNPDNAGGAGGSFVTVGGGGGGGYGCTAGGLPGAGLYAYILADRFFMGGGGGGGQQNNSVGGAGGAGGGIVILRMNTLRTVGPCGGLFISANGANGQSSIGAPPDGAGGGGAGGSVYLIVNTLNIDPTCSVTCQANGGNGGGVTNTNPSPGNWVDCGGGGGGGGQGLVMCGGGMGGSGGSGWGGMGAGTASGTGGAHDPAGGRAANGTGAGNAGVMGFPGSPGLPVELLSFSGRAMSNGVLLEWSTATEHNSATFLVQRSRDALVWEPVAHLPAAGESQSTINYHSLDADPMPGLTFYRLEQYDLDGASEVFPMIAVEWQGPVAVSVFPNPADESLTISGTVDTPLTVTLTDAVGRRALVISLTAERRTIPLGDVANGAYVMTVSGTVGDLLKTTVVVRH